MSDTDLDSTADADSYVQIADGETVWRFDRDFLTSNWTCTFGHGCKGILDHDATELNQGCCSLGAHFGDGDAGQEEARQISAYVALLTPEQWQHHDTGTTPHVPNARIVPDPGEEPVSDRSTEPTSVAGFYGDAERTHTRVVDGACVFLNRPGFAGGDGCALHIAALEAGDSPTEWKPSVCWQLPLRVDWELTDAADPLSPERATVRRWSRSDWGAHGTTMAWCCTERSDGGEAFSGSVPVVDGLADELTALAGEAVYVELRRRLRPT